MVFVYYDTKNANAEDEWRYCAKKEKNGTLSMAQKEIDLKLQHIVRVWMCVRAYSCACIVVQ